jgi:hypothetical protein
VARFVVASGRKLDGPKYYHVGIEQEIDECISRPPHHVLVEPLQEAVVSAGEKMQAIAVWLPDYDDGVKSRKFDPYADNYHALAYRIADDLYRSIYVEDRGLAESAFQSGPRTTEEWLKELESDEPPDGAHYRSMCDYVLTPFHRFVAKEWQFRKLKHNDMRSRLSRESDRMASRIRAAQSDAHRSSSESDEAQKTGGEDHSQPNDGQVSSPPKKRRKRTRSPTATQVKGSVEQRIVASHKPYQRHAETARLAGVFDKDGEPDEVRVRRVLNAAFEHRARHEGRRK